MNRTGNSRAFVLLLAASALPAAFAQAPPTVTKAFATATVLIGSGSLMTLTLTNPTAFFMTNVTITDTLPSGLQIGSAIGTGGSCGGGSGGTGLSDMSYTVNTLGPGVVCTVSVQVLGTGVGVHLNTSGSPSGVIGGTTYTGTPSSASLEVLPATLPTLTKSFASPTVQFGSTRLMTLTVTNPSNLPMTNVKVADTLPAGLRIGGPIGTGASCGLGSGGTGLSDMSYTVNSLASGVSCAISVPVLGTAVGTHLNTTDPPTGMIAATTFTGNPASASLQVLPATLPTLTKSFASPTVAFGSSTLMTLTLTNPSNVAMTNVNVTDALPIGLKFAGSPGTGAACGMSMGSVAGNTTLSYAFNSLGPGVVCTLSIQVLGTAVGTYLNTTGSPTGVIAGTTTFTGTPASASLQVLPATLPTLTKSFAASAIGVGASTFLTLTLTNPSNVAMTNVNIADTLPSGLQFSGSPGTGAACGMSTGSVAGNIALLYAFDSLGPGVVCTISIQVLGVTAGAYLNTTGAPTGVIAGTTFTGSPASAYLQVGPVNPPAITKSFTPAQISVAGTTVIAFALTNANITAMTNVAFTDNLPAGLIVNQAPNATTTCGGTVTAVSNATGISFTGGSMPAIGSCTVTVTVQATTPGTKTNTTSNVTGVVNAQTLQGNPATATLVVDPSAVSFLIRYAVNLSIPGDNSVVNFTNSGASSTAGLPTGIQNGEICANIYAYSPDEQLVSCCSCNVTPNALNSLSVKADLGTNTLTPIIPSALVIKIIATAGGTACTASSAATANIAVLQPGLEAWGTTIHALPVTNGTPATTYGVTETAFAKAAISPAELDRMAGLCAFIRANGSGYGICKSCKVGGLGASTR